MRRFLCILAASTALATGGCNPTTLGIAASPLFVKKDHVNMMNASYAAVDQLSVQTQQKFKKSQPLVITDLREIIDPDNAPIVQRTGEKIILTNPKLGLMLTDQYKSRFIQLGYSVMEEGATKVAGTPVELSGTYEAVGRQLAVRLRLKNTKTGELLSMYEYWMPITSDIRRYMNQRGGGIPIYKMREGLGQIIDP